MINKVMQSAMEAVADIEHGSTILLAGFGIIGQPEHILHALLDQGARDLTIVCNNAGHGREGLAALIAAGRVRKIICSFPRTGDPRAFDEAYAAGKLELEICPQGTISERLRAAAAGLGGFLTRVSLDTALGEGKPIHDVDGVRYLFEKALHGDVALCKADRADRWGNLTYSKTARNFNPVMAAAAKLTIVQVREVVPLGELDPEHIVTPGIFVDRVVKTEREA